MSNCGWFGPGVELRDGHVSGTHAELPRNFN